MTQQFVFFLIRWVLNSLGLWIAALIFKDHGITYDESQGPALFLMAGFVLSLVNVILKPLAVILSLPAILLTLGLFTLLVNGFMVFIASKLVPGLAITFWTAVLAGMIISIINYIWTSAVEMQMERQNK